MEYVSGRIPGRKHNLFQKTVIELTNTCLEPKCRFCGSIIPGKTETLVLYKICKECVGEKDEHELNSAISAQALKWDSLKPIDGVCRTCPKRNRLINRQCMECYRMCTHEKCNKKAGDTGLCLTHVQTTTESECSVQTELVTPFDIL